jgi:predicted transcriptional regulator
MTQLQTVSTNLTSDTVARLEEVAENQNRSRSDVIQDAVDEYLNSLAWLGAEIEKARDSIKAGNFITHEEIKEKYRKMGVKC